MISVLGSLSRLIPHSYSLYFWHSASKSLSKSLSAVAPNSVVGKYLLATGKDGVSKKSRALRFSPGFWPARNNRCCNMDLVLCCCVSDNSSFLVPWIREFRVKLPMAKGHTCYLATMGVWIMENYNYCQSVRSNIALEEYNASVHILYWLEKLTHTVETPPWLDGPKALIDQFTCYIHAQEMPMLSSLRKTPDLPVKPQIRSHKGSQRERGCIRRDWIYFAWCVPDLIII